MTCQRLLLGFAALGLVFGSNVARADGPDMPTTSSETRTSIDRTWLYADDARVPAPLTAVATSNVTYTNVGSSPSRVAAPYRPFGSNVAQPGAMIGVGGEVGLLPRLSVMAMGEMGAGGTGASPNAGAVAGLRVQLLPASLTNVHLVASGGYLREAWAGPVFDPDSGRWTPAQRTGDNGAWVQAAFSGDIQRLRLAVTAHGEHIFIAGRDAADLMLQAGASYRIVGGFRAGVEWVGQDMEEALTPAAEGGARHFVGPIASLQLFQNRLTIVGGPSVGLSAYSPQLLGRVAASFGF